jgi:hypothetical protein
MAQVGVTLGPQANQWAERGEAQTDAGRFSSGSQERSSEPV